MQTAMQKLISQIKEEMTIDTIPKEWYYCLKSVIMSIEETYLEMEKQQIIDANYDGQRLHSKSCTKQMLQDNAESYFAETYDEYPLKVSNIDVDRIMDLAEKSRNALNDVAHLCSGEVEEHIFDMGFYQGYKKRNGEINIK